MGSGEIIETLKKCELFSDLSESELRTIAKSGSVEEFEGRRSMSKGTWEPNYIFCPKVRYP